MPQIFLRATAAVMLAGSLLAAPAATTPAFAAAAADLDTSAATTLAVNFGAQTSPAPATFLADWGQPFGARTDANQGTGHHYGWVEPGTTTPQTMVGSSASTNSRGSVDMQQGSANGGDVTSGAWQAALTNGVYIVTVMASGTPGMAQWLNIEDQNALAQRQGSATAKSVTRTVVITDGRLTITPTGGTETRINQITVSPLANATRRPSVSPLQTPNLAVEVSRTDALVEDLSLPGGGVDAKTLTAANIQLTAVADGSVVRARYATSGGADTINISPVTELKRGTAYRITITDRVKDVHGSAFVPFTSVFTTTAANPSPGAVAFVSVPTRAKPGFYTAITKGPDGKLYAATLMGAIMRYTIDPDGRLSHGQQINTVGAHATAAKLYGAPNRSVIGLAFDPSSTAHNLKLWISDNSDFLGAGEMPDFSDHLAYLTGANLETYNDVLTNLPRSIRDHETNSIAFGPDGALYFSQAANNAMGAPDSAWGGRAEHPLTAAILRLDLHKMPTTLPLDVKTLDAGGSYDPFAAGAPLTIYASGVRNAYDLVWHSNGHLYAPTNGSAAGGNTPAIPQTLPAVCLKRNNGKPYTGPTSVPHIKNAPDAQTDFVYDVKKGAYYGHPNPSRCEWVLDNGNPTAGVDPFEVSAYPVGTLADPNYDLADTYDAGLHASADGSVEYLSGAFGGALKGKLLVVRYSAGQDIESFDVAANGRLSNRVTGIVSGLQSPLAMYADPTTGNIYVSETANTSSSITLLRPQVTADVVADNARMVALCATIAAGLIVMLGLVLGGVALFARRNRLTIRQALRLLAHRLRLRLRIRGRRGPGSDVAVGL